MSHTTKRKVKKYKIEVELSNFEVSDCYYSFKYKVKSNGKLMDESSYSGDYDNGMTPKEWLKEIEKGDHALGLVLDSLFE